MHCELKLATNAREKIRYRKSLFFNQNKLFERICSFSQKSRTKRAKKDLLGERNAKLALELHQ